MRTTILKFFKDDFDNYGVAPTKCIEDNLPDTHKYHMSGFYAFWSGYNGIFHDVFEHWFEFSHPYFKGKYAMGIAGEVAAMGAMYYFMNDLSITSRTGDDRRNRVDDRDGFVIDLTAGQMNDAIEHGNISFGHTFDVSIPKQPPVHDDFEQMILKHWKQVKKYKLGGDCENSKIAANEFKQSLTLEKLRRAYRWGFKMAEETAPQNCRVQSEIYSFIDAFNIITEKRNAEQLAHDFKHITFKVVPGANMKWDANFYKHSGRKVHYSEMF